MPIHTLPLGALETNCYIVYKDNNALVIDPGGTSTEDLTTIIDVLKEEKCSVQAILCTHLHFDHVFSTARLHEYLQVPIFASDADDFLLKGGIRDWPNVEPFQKIHITEGPQTLGVFSYEVLYTPGHTPGSLSLYFKEMNSLFTGDLLFYHSVGRTDLPRGDTQTLLNSLHKKIFVLPPKTIVYPGHGCPTSVEEERTNNPYI